jgi:hypothetical protein
MDNQKARKVLRYCFASLSLVIASGYLMQQAVAENLPSRLEATAERESFRQLEEGVLLFGMEMSTVWKSPSGEMIEARGDLAVDLSGATPSVSFTPHITATSGEAYAKIASANGNEAVVVNDGTGNATGVVQLVQSGGDFNTASNNFQFDVNTGVAGTEAGGNGENSLFSATGTAVSIQHGVDGLGMSIVMPGEGEVRQGVYAGQGLHQSVQLTGSHHEVHNLTRMQVQMNQELGSKVTDGQLRRALEAARGLERHH